MIDAVCGTCFVIGYLSNFADLPSIPHLAGDSRILRTIVVSPLHVMNLYESPTLTTFCL